MRELQNKPLDARQLKILLTLLEQRSVTRTADVLEQSQPYISLVLRKLRATLGDPLLVRSGSKLVPTERALQIIGPLRATLAGIDEIIRPAKAFIPESASCTFHIASADCMEAFFLPRLITRIRTAAPEVRLVLRSIEAGFDYAAALAAGELDVVIGNWPNPPENLRTVPLLADDIVCLFNSAHPLAQVSRMSMSDYLQAEHLAPMPISSAHPGPIDSRLAELGLSRDIRIIVPEFNLAPYVLLSSQLIFTSCWHFAQHYANFLPIASVPAPETFGKMRFYLLWHERAQVAPANSWLRQQIISVARNLQHPDPSVAVQAHCPSDTISNSI
ncbi:MAG: LysR family transcriptional regulator [Gammaproteobacteria bacterium]